LGGVFLWGLYRGRWRDSGWIASAQALRNDNEKAKNGLLRQLTLTLNDKEGKG